MLILRVESTELGDKGTREKLVGEHHRESELLVVNVLLKKLEDKGITKAYQL